MDKKPSYKALEKRIQDLETELTDCKHANEALRKSEEKYKVMWENTGTATLIMQADTTISMVNSEFERWCGLPRDAIEGKMSWTEFVAPEDLAQMKRYHAERRQKDGKAPRTYEFGFVDKDKNVKHILNTVSLIPGTTDSVASLIDISSRKQAEEALRESQQRIRAVFDQTFQFIGLMTSDGILIEANRAALEFAEVEESEVLGKPFWETVWWTHSPELQGQLKDAVKRARSGETVRFEAYHPDLSGNTHYMDVSIKPVRDKENNVVFLIPEGRDITEHKLAEDALRESEERYRSILEYMDEGYWETDLPGNFTFFNNSVCKFFGYSQDELLGMNNRDYSTPEEAARIYQIFSEVYRTGKPVKIFDYEIIAKDGSKVVLEGSASLMRDNSGQPIGFRGLNRDVTERKKAEEALRESEERYRLLVENANDAIFIIENGMVKFHNFKTEEMTGYSEKELSNNPFINIIHPDDREMVFERRMERLLGKNPPSIYSFRMINRSGTELSVQINSVLITWKGKLATLNFIRDITEQKRLETQLQQAQKMEAMGTLAGGIAHDFNNLLMGIQGRTSLMLTDANSSHTYLEHLKGIEEYVKSAAGLTKQLLGFARGGKYEVKPTRLNELIAYQNQMFGRTRKEVTIREKFDENLWTVEVDRGQIEQVLLNIYVNAWQAMSGGGDLYIQTENLFIDEDHSHLHGVDPGVYVRISITDTGAGMDKETQQKIFDPFFTTKKIGKASGLGLASAYGIIKNHNGFIDVDSERGEGSTFNIYLPASEKEAVKEKELTQGSKIIKGSETILLVDDEKMIIDVGGEMLERLGYRVRIAEDGEKAIEKVSEMSEKIDLVILDMIMPGMDGGITFDRIRKIRPELPVMLSSGYSINGQATEIMNRGCNGFIQKPFNMAKLSKKVRKILDEAKGLDKD